MSTLAQDPVPAQPATFTLTLPTIHQNFERQAALRPESVALKFGEETVSYRELNGRANRLADLLRQRGVTTEVPVALYLERSVEMVVSILAVLKAGGVYVPIDLVYPPDRIAFMLEDTAAPVLLTQWGLRPPTPDSVRHVICVNEPLPTGLNENNLPSNVTADNAAYIIYTSGSTGKPKGVIVTHHNVVRLLKSTEHWYRFNERDVWPLFHSYSFDMSVWELWGALFYGGRLIIVPHAIARSPQEFYALLAREKVTFLNQTPSAFRQLMWADASAAEKLDLHLRFVTLGGEALELQSLRDWFARRGDYDPVIVNKYGITETTVHTTYRPITIKDVEENLGSVIGVPIPDLTVHLLDEHLKPVPAGEPGEICVGGAGVARGYLNRPELNAARFVPDPFAASPEAKMYRSGDLARVNAHGEMEYLGRMDHQVKIRGYRVELGEIESALNAHPQIRESAVMARGDGAEKRLVAYIVPRRESPGISELRGYLATSLPEYMVPAAFVSLASFPLTNNGKIDRRALPEPEASRPALSVAYAAPENETEKKLAEVWSRVLHVQEIGRNDNFFELGGDSIRAIVCISRARDQGIHFTLEQLFKAPTVATLAAAARNASQPGGLRTRPFELISASDKAKLPEGIEDGYPVAALQLGMFFHNELDPLSAMYHDVFSYSVQARFDAAKLQTAMTAATARHPMLRTSFHLAGYSQPLQLVHAGLVMPFTWEDLRDIAAGEHHGRVLQWIETEKRRPFNREQAPLMRFHAQVQTDSKFQLFISFHHSCTDGWSLAALITEILHDYSRLLADGQVDGSKPATCYRDFVALERATAKSAETIKFWTELLEDSKLQLLPRWPKHLCTGGQEQVRGPEVGVDPRVLAGLKALAQKAGVPLKTVLLAAHQRVLAVLHGQTDVTTGLISNGRPEEGDADRLIGLFLNAVPFRTILKKGSWLDFVKQTFAVEQSVLPHRRFPLAEAQKLHGHPLTETAFDFVHFHVFGVLAKCPNLKFEESAYFEANNLTTYTTFMLDPTSTRLELHIDYDPNMLCRDQVEEMNALYLETLARMSSEPDGDCLAFSPLRLRRIRQLEQWNNTASSYPSDKGIHELFAEQALATPDKAAVCDARQTLTYRELNEQSNRVAEVLKKQGVTRETLVGICVDRSVRMLTGLLGILKAGGAYVPLDPSFPRERVAYMIENAGLQLVVSEDCVMDALPKSGAKVISLDHLMSMDAAEGAVPQTAGSPGSASPLAYVIYTSGSTGKPKGVQVEQRSVVNLLVSAASKLKVSAEDNLLAVTTLSFDIAGLELFMPLVTGATVTIVDRETVIDGPALAKLIESSGATLMQATPSTWRLLIESGWKSDQARKSLRAICGGEALSPALASELLKRCQTVWNFYGPTETTIWSTACKVNGTEPVTIGRPLANTEAYVLDSQMEPVPVGTIGELWLGGHGLARGYLGQPDLTNERFVQNPFEQTFSDRLYRTGDLARFLPDGRIECLGRVDHQVKIRGYRIELGEIETALRQHHGIAEAVVTARPGRQGDNRLTAYFVKRNGDPGVKALREHLSSRLPHYMVPSHFVVLDKLPLTPNGKIDMKGLPDPELTAAASTTFVSPEGEMEQTLARIWRDALEVPRVGAEDNIFDLGADSLSATRAFARMNTTLGTRITLKDIFEHPTVRLQARIAGQVSASTPSVIRALPRRTVAMKH